jgi:GDPmannose 4,6-dehydratase
MKNIALITGIAGQDGSYLAELLLSKGYQVHGLIRRSSNYDHPNISNIKDQVTFHTGDLGDGNNIRNLIDQIRPTEIYNLAAQSHVKVSFEMPELTGNINALGPLRILDAIRSLKMESDVKFYQASTSEMFGLAKTATQNEDTPFYPGSPYSCAKLYAHYITVNYRQSYKMFGCSGILFNHESPRRGELFVTRKVTKAFANIKAGLQSHVELGNLDSLRDWGHAADYVEAMWQMLQAPEADDYVVATGEQHSIREFCNISADYFGMKLEWAGSGLDETATDVNTGQVVLRVNPAYYRPVDVVNICGDSAKIRNTLGWRPRHTFTDLVSSMCEYDEGLAKR